MTKTQLNDYNSNWNDNEKCENSISILIILKSASAVI